ncbi:MAG: hypothetical protein JWQ19_784 [Subtercola sp.]|nr:hypothetical protein [Subtercola sp.]
MTTPSGAPAGRSNFLAFASLVVSVISLFLNPFVVISIVGAVLGFFGLRQSRVTGAGRILSLVGLWLGVASTVVTLILIFVLPTT